MAKNEPFDCRIDPKGFLKAPGWTVRPEGRLDNLVTAWDDFGFRVAVHFPGLVRESWEFDRIENGYALFNSIEVFEKYLGSLPEYPQKNARELCSKTWGGKWPRVLSEQPEQYWKPFISKMESEFIKIRDLTPDEKELPFVHAFDKRMMFLSAARGGFFGPGEYTEIAKTKFSDLGKGVGLVQIEKPKFESVFSPEIPGFLKLLFDKTDLFYTPYLSILSDYVGTEIKIKKGWIWPEPVRIFEKFSRVLGDAIKETRSDEQSLLTANRAFKSIYTMFFGWLGRLCVCKDCDQDGEAGERCKRRGYGAELFRPDWRGLIVAGAGANLLRNVLEVYKYTKRLPVAINHDCLIYFSENENWKLDFDKTCLSDLNRFTHEWTSKAGPVLEAIKSGLNAGQIDKLIKNGG